MSHSLLTFTVQDTIFMNKYLRQIIAVFILFACLIKADTEKKWYSQLKLDVIEKENAGFSKNLKKNNIELLRALNRFGVALIEKDYDVLYGYRSDEYKKIVSRKVFEKTVHSESDAPVAVYYSLIGSMIDHRKATIYTYYVQEKREFKYVVTTIDNWKYDEIMKKWVFVSNTLSWGSPFGNESLKPAQE